MTTDNTAKLNIILEREGLQMVPIVAPSRHPGGGSYCVRWKKGLVEVAWPTFYGPGDGPPVAIILWPDRDP